MSGDEIEQVDMAKDLVQQESDPSGSRGIRVEQRNRGEGCELPSPLHKHPPSARVR